MEITFDESVKLSSRPTGTQTGQQAIKSSRGKRSQLRPVLAAVSILTQQRLKGEWSTRSGKNPPRLVGTLHGCDTVCINEKKEGNEMISKEA